jgi:uncharacterized protein YjbI with pentapeptide repeats
MIFIYLFFFKKNVGADLTRADLTGADLTGSNHADLSCIFSLREN